MMNDRMWDLESSRLEWESRLPFSVTLDKVVDTAEPQPPPPAA